MQISLPPVIAGTSTLGNLYEELPYQQKKELVAAYIETTNGIPVFDTAGKYGAGLALEVLGQILNELGINRDRVLISNKLGWRRVPLESEEPRFEPGVWRNIRHDAIQDISYDGILRCYEEGNRLLGGYHSTMVSVHDPDEFLAAAADENDERNRFAQILEAYRPLFELKEKGLVSYIGIGAKNWRVIQQISEQVNLDWVMIATSLSIIHQPPELLLFLKKLKSASVFIINSAVLHGGFLAGSDYYNYRQIKRTNPKDAWLFDWRDQYQAICAAHNLDPVHIAIRYASLIPEVGSVALGCSSADTMRKNMEAVHAPVARPFWDDMEQAGLLASSVSLH